MTTKQEFLYTTVVYKNSCFVTTTSLLIIITRGKGLTEIQPVEQNLFVNDWRPFIQLLLLKLKLFELFQTKLKRQRKFVIIFFILNNMMSFYQDIHRDKIHLNL